MEKIGKWLPTLAIFLIIVSSIKLAIFYNIFNIKIVYYVGVTEYIPLFIDDLHHLGLFLGPVILGGVSGILYYRKISKEGDGDTIENNVSLRRQIRYIVVFILIVSIPLVFTLLYCETLFEKLVVIQYIAFVFWFLPLILPTNKEKRWFYFGICLFGLTISSIVISAYKDAYKILDKKNDVEYKIILKDKTTLLKESVEYVGKSENYIFLYDLKNKVSIIRRFEEIEEIQIKPRNPQVFSFLNCK